MMTDDAEHRSRDPGLAVAGLGGDFASGTATANGTTIHYVRGGRGPALVLLHGFPQDWFEWRRLMPRLAESFTVIAIDLRGVGGSAAPSDGYAAADLAEDVRQLLGALEVDRAHIVGHDTGGWVAYAFSRLHPRATSTLLIMETLIPGIEPFQRLDIDVPLWHGAFHMIPDLPEALVADRQAIYFRYFFNVGTNDNRGLACSARRRIRRMDARRAITSLVRGGNALMSALDRRNSELRTRTPIWVVRAGADVYVRAAYGAGDGWHGVARTSGRARISAGGVERDVAIEDADDTVLDQVDAG